MQIARALSLSLLTPGLEHWLQNLAHMGGVVVVMSLSRVNTLLFFKSAFTLNVTDSSVESPNTIVSHLELTPTYHEHLM